MSPDEILAELSLPTATLPEAALHAAAEHREALVEDLLAALSRFVELAQNPMASGNEPETLSVVAMYLLAQFRDGRAFAYYEALCRLPEESSEYWLGDILNQDFGSFLASTCDGDVRHLQRLAEDQSLYMYARWAALAALITLLVNGVWTRQAMIAWLQEVWPKWLAPESDGDHTPLIAAVSDLGAPGLLPQVRESYAAGRVDPFFATLEEVESCCTQDEQAILDDLRLGYQYVDDAAQRMSWQAQFHPAGGDDEDYPFDDEFPPDEDFADFLAQAPYVRVEPKIGRNDPCPCGSGRKYKKCCLGSDGSGPADLAVLR